MQSASTPRPDEIEAFARRYGLAKLDRAHIERMAELAVYVAELGRMLPRPMSKSDQPAQTAEFAVRAQR